MRPKPQLSQQASAETAVTSAIAAAGLLGRRASASMARFTAGAAASALPHTSTKAICMAKASRFHTPPPQCSSTSTGVWLQTPMATTAATSVSSMAKIKGSGSQRCTNLTQNFIISLHCYYQPIRARILLGMSVFCCMPLKRSAPGP